MKTTIKTAVLAIFIGANAYPFYDSIAKLRANISRTAIDRSQEEVNRYAIRYGIQETVAVASDANKNQHAYAVILIGNGHNSETFVITHAGTRTPGELGADRIG